MARERNIAISICLIVSCVSLIANAQHEDALQSREFHLEEMKITKPGAREVIMWELCLNQYYVMISGQKEYIPVFAIYSESCFKTMRDRAIDALERASNSLDSLSHGETLQVFPAPKNGNFTGSSIWTVPMNMQVEHPGLVFRIENEDVAHFGFRARDADDVANYVKDIYEVMWSLFVGHTNPSNSPAMSYPYVKILKRIWLDARQHAEKIRDVPPEQSAQSVTQQDIQEAIDMLSESQRLRLLGIALLIPSKG